MAFKCAGLSRFQPAPSPKVISTFTFSFLQGSFALLMLFGFSQSQLPLVFLLFFHNPPEKRSWPKPIRPRRLCAWLPL